MVNLIHSEGVVRLRMKNVVCLDEAVEARTKAHEWMSKENVRTVITDIRGCKPIDPATMDALREIYQEASQSGVTRFVRIGEGTLCAIQMTAIERITALSEKTCVCVDDTDLPV